MRENCQGQSCKAFIGLTNRAKLIGGGGGRPILPEILDQIADVRSLFARSDSAVTPSDKNLININRKSTTRFPMSRR